MPIKLFLAGDVMTGRGIDQVLPHPCDPVLFEDYVSSARDYVALAERAHGRIDAPVAIDYVWGDALVELRRQAPDARIVNLETAITLSDAAEPKGINYRMSPGNIAVLGVASLDCCALANNHVLDWGETGLQDTLTALKMAGIKPAGAGANLADAMLPAVIDRGSNCRIVVHGVGSPCSGIPRRWAAGAGRPGVRLLPDLSSRTAQQVAEQIGAYKRHGDVTVVSVHWGSNWGYEIGIDQINFARTLIDFNACDVLHGHSSHHARAIEVYRGKLILYGCGDFINDYEAIRGYKAYRGDLSLMYLPRLDDDGRLQALTLVPFQMRRFRLQRASMDDAKWLQTVLSRESFRFGVSFALRDDCMLDGEWA